MAEKKKPIRATFAVKITLRRDALDETTIAPNNVILARDIKNMLYDKTGFADDEIHVSVERTDK